MTPTLAIARRELCSFLLSPVGYLTTALFLFFTALMYFAAAPVLVRAGFTQGQPASLRIFFEVAVWIFFLVAPAVSMRVISEELRLGTIESLMTAPVREGQVVLGKFLGCFAFLAIMLLPTLVFIVALERYGRPDYGELACGYLGLLLVGGACLASGILASTMTSSQVLAYLLTTFFWMLLLLATMVLPALAAMSEGFVEEVGGSARLEGLLDWLRAAGRFLAIGNPLVRVRGFIIGLVDTLNIVYFVSITVVFLVAATRSLGLRRWP